jgi:hypothetical protein
MCGYENSVKCIEDLVEDFKVFEEANSKDNAEDKDGDGVADVKQISSQELATRKTLLFLKTVDPGRLTTAIAGIAFTCLSHLQDLVRPPLIPFFIFLYRSQ